MLQASLLPASKECCLAMPVSCSVQATVLSLAPRTLGFWKDASFSLCTQVELPKLSAAGRGIAPLTNPDGLHTEEEKAGSLHVTGKQLNRSAKHCPQVTLSYRRIVIKLYTTSLSKGSKIIILTTQRIHYNMSLSIEAFFPLFCNRNENETKMLVSCAFLHNTL